MNPFHLLSNDLRSLGDRRIELSPIVSANQADCLEIEVDGVDFLLTRTSAWDDGFTLTAELGQLAATDLAPLLNVMSLNMDHALGDKPTFGIDLHDGRAVLTYAQRIAMLHCEAHVLAAQMQEVANLRKDWVAVGWLSPHETEPRR